MAGILAEIIIQLGFVVYWLGIKRPRGIGTGRGGRAADMEGPVNITQRGRGMEDRSLAEGKVLSRSRRCRYWYRGFRVRLGRLESKRVSDVHLLSQSRVMSSYLEAVRIHTASDKHEHASHRGA